MYIYIPISNLPLRSHRGSRYSDIDLRLCMYGGAVTHSRMNIVNIVNILLTFFDDLALGCRETGPGPVRSVLCAQVVGMVTVDVCLVRKVTRERNYSRQKSFSNPLGSDYSGLLTSL